MFRVLIADADTQHSSQLLEVLCDVPGTAVATCERAVHAIQLCEMLLPDLVLTAMEFPDGSGTDVLRSIEARGVQAPPFLFMTTRIDRLAGALDPSRNELDCEAFDVVRKPVPPDRMHEIVAAFARRKSAAHSDSSASLSSTRTLLRMALLSGHSVRVLVGSGEDRAGEIVVAHGGVWSAHDGQGVGLPAFDRLVALSLPAVCELIQDGTEGECNLTVDEGGEEVGSAPEQQEQPAGERRQGGGSSPQDLGGNDAEFGRAVDRGIEALLRKSYTEALEAFRIADSIRPRQPLVTANLARLRKLGVE